MASYNAGIVTAYGAAVRGGYTGTYEQFCAQQANYAQTAAAVEQAKTDAQAAAQRAQDVADSIPEDYTELTEEVSNLKEDITDLKDTIEYFDGEYKQFHVNAGAVHSATLDQIYTNINQGEKFVLSYERHYNNALQFYAYDINGNGTLIWSPPSGKRNRVTITAQIDIVKIGMTVGVNESADDYEFAISKESTNPYELTQKVSREEAELLNAKLDMNVSRNMIGPDLDVLYPITPLKTGDIVTVSAFNPASVSTWTHIRFHTSDGTQIKYYQFDPGNAYGRQITLDLGEATAYYISVWHDCGSPLMVEHGTKTDFIPHYTTNYEKYLNSKSNFGEFELFLPEQAEIIRKNLATARMAKRLCFGHTSDNHSTVDPFICNIIDLSDAKFIVNTGDVVQDQYSDAYTNFPNMINAMTKPYYITLGNHDVYKAPSISDIFSKYFAPIIDHNGQTGLNKTYYSVDFVDEGIKCIFLDLYDAIADYSVSMETIIAGKMSATQINWLLGQLDAALSSHMHVCVFLHLSPEMVGEKELKFFDVNTTESRKVTYTFIPDVIDAFLDGGSVTFNYDGNSYTHTFASSGIFVGYFCGHMHCDCVGKLKMHNRQNAFSVTRPFQSSDSNVITDGTYRHGSSKWGSYTFNYVTVDPTTRHVSVMRVLQQETKYGFKRDFVTMEY